MVYVKKNLPFSDMLKGLLIEHLEKLIIGLLNIKQNVEGFLKKLVNQKKNKRKKKYPKKKYKNLKLLNNNSPISHPFLIFNKFRQILLLKIKKF